MIQIPAQRGIPAPRLIVLALSYGAVAGLLALLTLSGMMWLQGIVWGASAAAFGDRSPLQIVLTILAGGALLVLLDRIAPSEDIETLLRQSADPGGMPRRAVLATGLSAIVAVACGGAVGPEAGILAVVAQLSAIVSHRLRGDIEAQRVVGQAGTAGALGGFYGSPPGAAAIEGDTIGPRKALELVAGFSGFLVFLGVARLVAPDGVQRIELPALTESSTLEFGLVLVALAGAAAGLLFRALHGVLHRLTAAIRHRWIVILAGTGIFAMLAAALPLVRFSGHHELVELWGLTESGSWGELALLAAAKILALALCLASGWRGGEFFPLVFVGAAVGGALAAVSAVDAGAAIAVGMAAAAAVGWKRPLAALLVLVLLVETPAALPLLLGAGVGYVVNLLLPDRDAGRASSDPSDPDFSIP